MPTFSSLRAIILMAVLFGCVVGEAAYRAYQLKVTPQLARGRRGPSRLVMSTVDHLQWEHLYAGYRVERVELVDTWYCPGDTSRREICRKPRQRKATARGPASLVNAYDKPKRVGLPLNRQPIIP